MELDSVFAYCVAKNSGYILVLLIVPVYYFFSQVDHNLSFMGLLPEQMGYEDIFKEPELDRKCLYKKSEHYLASGINVAVLAQLAFVTY